MKTESFADYRCLIDEMGNSGAVTGFGAVRPRRPSTRVTTLDGCWWTTTEKVTWADSARTAMKRVHGGAQKPSVDCGESERDSMPSSRVLDHVGEGDDDGGEEDDGALPPTPPPSVVATVSLQSVKGRQPKRAKSDGLPESGVNVTSTGVLSRTR